jgi:hypothetical protein
MISRVVADLYRIEIVADKLFDQRMSVAEAQVIAAVKRGVLNHDKPGLGGFYALDFLTLEFVTGRE